MKKAKVLALSIFGLVLAISNIAYAETPSPTGLPENVVTVINSTGELNKFAALLKSSGLADELSAKGGKFTIFAPDNAAMSKMPPDFVKGLMGDKEKIKTLVGHHMVNGSVIFSGNIKGRRASPSTMGGGMIGFDGTSDVLKVGDGTITEPDLKAANGVVHIVSAVFIPDLLKAPKEKAPEEVKQQPEEDILNDAVKGEGATSAVDTVQKEGAKVDPAAPVKAEPKVAPTSVPTTQKEDVKGKLKKWFGF